MALADYLAKNYLTQDSKPDKKSRKRKRKDGAFSGLIIADDDALGWDKNGFGKDEDDGPLTGQLHLPITPTVLFLLLTVPFNPLVTASSSFRKAKTSTWQTIGAPTPSSTEQAAADLILASAAAENRQALGENGDDAPTIADDSAKMESGAHAGLQSADAVTAQLDKKKREERRRYLEDGDEHSGKGKETIYRDASGRIINVAMKRAEARKKAEEELAKKRAEEEGLKGDVQRAEKVKRREDLADAKFLTVARYADDEALNEELKERERWNDPMAKYIESKGGGKKSVSGKPMYKGAAPPNRYGIRPGYRWDGVDRGNGFEKEWFGARNRVENRRDLEYQWQMDE